MIHFHATRSYVWTIEKFIASWAPSLSASIVATPYEDIDLRAPVPSGLHIFSDLERLSPQGLGLARQIHDRLARHPGSYATWNDPSAWSGRVDLHRSLATAGLNDFRTFRIDEVDSELRFPVFLRWEHEHTGSLAGPIRTMPVLQRRAAALLAGRGAQLRPRLLVVELLDVRGSGGLFRKYSAMKLGDRLVPRHVLFSTNWITKTPDRVTTRTVEEETAYLDGFPDSDAVDEAFRIAGIDYGRIDYGVHEGRLQIWEINTNPHIVPRRATIARARLRSQRESAVAIAETLAAAAATAPAGRSYRLTGPLAGRRARNRRPVVDWTWH